MRRYLQLLVPLALAGCVSLNSVSLTQIPAQRKQRVRASAERFVIFGINFDNDYVDDVRDELRSRCKNGLVTGILTKDEYINYFLYLVAKRRIEAQGYCIR